MYLKILIFSLFLFVEETNCKCQGCDDYYGTCRKDGEVWVDDKTWQYTCQNVTTIFKGCVSSKRNKNQFVPVNSNLTINNFWVSCFQNEEKLKYEQEPSCSVNDTVVLHVEEIFRATVFQKICKPAGVWILGCFYKDEIERERVIPLGETAYVGLVGHNCKEISSNPGVIRYWTALKPNATIATSADRGINNNLPENATNLLSKEPVSWSIANAEYFIKNIEEYNEKIRYL